MTKITITHTDGNEEKFSLEGKMFSVGRASDNAIVLRDGTSSQYHAVLKENENGQYIVIDLVSKNHTQVNGNIISSHVLRDADRILFGDTLALFEAAE